MLTVQSLDQEIIPKEMPSSSIKNCDLCMFRGQMIYICSRGKACRHCTFPYKCGAQLTLKQT